MKKIEAIIKPHKLEDVKEALGQIGIRGLTAYDAKGFGRQKGHKEVYLGSDLHAIDFVPKVKIELVVEDEKVDEAVEAIIVCGRTGNIGDGKVFIYDCQGAVRIRTGERGPAAL